MASGCQVTECSASQELDNRDHARGCDLLHTIGSVHRAGRLECFLHDHGDFLSEFPEFDFGKCRLEGMVNFLGGDIP